MVRFVDELVARLKRAGATGAKTVRADSGFWSWKLIDRLSHHNIAWSITVTNHASIRKAIRQIPDNAWRSIDYTIGSHAQVAETTYVTGGYHSQRPKRSVQLIVRRTRLTEGAQHQLWPDWRHHAFITNRTDLNCAAADRFHREHATVELAIRDLKEGTGLNHIPSGHYAANCAWLACAVLAHNLGTWTANLAGQPPVTNRTAPNSPSARTGEMANDGRASTVNEGIEIMYIGMRWATATNIGKEGRNRRADNGGFGSLARQIRLEHCGGHGPDRSERPYRLLEPERFTRGAPGQAHEGGNRP